MKYYAIIVAGGSGSRMQTETPKQFLLLNNLPLLMHTIKAFALSQTQPEILLVLHETQHEYWADLCKKFNFNIQHQVIAGGKERFHSVQNAVNTIDDDGFIAIHDAVRPLVSSKLIDDCYHKAKELGNAVVAVPSNDSVRQLKEHNSIALNRNEIYLVQTPQAFATNTLKKAYEQTFTNQFTDDASVVEAFGEQINLIDGERSNIKITYPIDLELASLLLKK